MAFVPFVESDQPTMAAFNEKFQQAIAASIAGGVRIEVGSYVGTGTFGVENPVTLTFEFEPKVLILTNTFVGTYSPMMAVTLFPTMTQYRWLVENNQTDSGRLDMNITWGGKSVSWYSDGWNTIGSGWQLNYKNNVYPYIAIG